MEEHYPQELKSTGALEGARVVVDDKLGRSSSDTAEVTEASSHAHFEAENDDMQLKYKQLDQKLVFRVATILSICQFTLMISALTAKWATLSVYVDGESYVVLQDDINVWGNLKTYREDEVYDIVLLIVVFGITIPLFVIIVYIFTIYTHYIGLVHEKWLPVREDVEYLTEMNEKVLLPWWKGDNTFDHSLERIMKISTIALDYLKESSKFFFSEIVLTTILLQVVKFEVFLGNDVDVQVSTKCYFGGYGYNLSVSLAFLTLALLNYNLYSWTRSYKERVIKVEYRNREGAVHIASNDETHGEDTLLSSIDEVETIVMNNNLTKPLLEENIGHEHESIVESESMPIGQVGTLLITLMSICLVSWIFLASGIEIMRYDYRGTKVDMLTTTSESISFFKYFSDLWDATEFCKFNYRVATIAYPAIFIALFPTICMFLLISMVVGSQFKSFYESPTYRYIVLTIRLLSPCACHEVFAVVSVIVMLEVESITKPLLNNAGTCQAHDCLYVKGKITFGTIVVGLWALSLHALYHVAMRRFGHVMYRLH